MPTLHCGFDPEAAADFAALLGRPGAPLNLRAFPPTSASAETKKRIGPRKPPWGDTATIEQAQAEGRGIYAVINPGGDTKASITHAVAHFAESDEGTKDEQWARVAASPLPPPSFVIDGGGRSLHFYWVFLAWITDLAAWQRNQKRIAKLLDFDPSVQDPSRVMRLPGAWYIGTDLQPTCRTTIVHRSGALYSFEQIEAALLPDAPEPLLQPVAVPPVVPMSPPPAGDDDQGRRERAALDQLQRIPPRTPGTNTRPDYLRLLWGLAAILGPDDAGRVMASHSPAWAAEEDLTDKAAEADGSINAGTFFEVARSVWGVTGPRRRSPAGSASTPPPAGVMEAISAEAYRLHCLPPNDPTRTPGTTDLIRRFVDAVYDSPGADAQISDFLDGLAGLITRAPAKKIVKERREEIRNDRRQQQKQERLEQVRQQAAALPDPFHPLASRLPAPPDGPVNSGDLVNALRPVIETGEVTLRYNQLHDSVEIDGVELDPADLKLSFTSFQCLLWKTTQADAAAAVLRVARNYAYHPVQAYIDGLVANDAITPVPIDAMASQYLATTDPLYDRMFFVSLVGAVKRIYEPGCQHDTVLVFEGPQGGKKSTFISTLFGQDWHSATETKDLKDTYISIHSNWCRELSELQTHTSKHEVGTLRTLITTAVDVYRKPYAAADARHRRRSTFWSTVNGLAFLADPDGHRRFLVIHVGATAQFTLDLARLAVNRDAIWKAAYLAYRSGAENCLTYEEQEDSNARNRHLEVESGWDGLIENWVANPTLAVEVTGDYGKIEVKHFPAPPERFDNEKGGFTIDEILIGSGCRRAGQINPGMDHQKAALPLKRAGWEKRRVNAGRSKVTRWFRGT
jgi:hypothetical protein